MAQSVQETIVEITRELATLLGKDNDTDNARREDLYARLRLIGETAAFFGNYSAMKRLHDAAEKLVNDSNEAGYFLNRAWDRIGGWAS